MTTEEKLQQAAKEIIIRNNDKIKEFEALLGEIGSGFELASLIQRMFLTGAKSPESLEYWKEKEKLYSEEEVIILLQTYRFDLSAGKTPSIGDTTGDWFEQNKKK